MSILGCTEDWQSAKEYEIKHGNIDASIEDLKVYYLCILVDINFHPAYVLGRKTTFGMIRKDAVRILLESDPSHWENLLEVSIGNKPTSDATLYDDNAFIWETLDEGSIIWITHVRREGYKVMKAICRGFTHEELMKHSKTGDKKLSVQTYEQLELKGTDRYVNMRRCLTCRGIFPKLNVCGGCRKVAYCSSECQKADWTEHKPICKAHRR